jgi:tetratricopeptide (TPR) repeat protein
MMQALYPDNHPDVAASLHNVGATYVGLGKVEEGLDYQQRALKMKQALYKGDHPEIAASLETMGIIYVMLGDLRKGLTCQERALAMRKALYKGNHHEIADSLSTVGITYQKLGDDKRGLDYHKKALTMRQALYPGNHADVVTSLAAVGMAYLRLGNAREGLSYQEQSLTMIQDLHPGNHPEVAASLNSMGVTYGTLGDAEKACDYKERALAMRQALYKGDHPEIAASLSTVGAAYRELGDAEKGLDYQERALKMMRAIYKGDHPDIATCLTNIGIGCADSVNAEKGLSYQKQALEMRRNLYKGNHPEVADSLENVGMAYRYLGDIQNTLDYHEQALTMRQALYPGDHPMVAISLHNVGIAYYNFVGNIPKGLDYHEQALKMRKNLYQGNHPEVADSLRHVAIGYQMLGNAKQSNRYYSLANKMMRALGEKVEFKGQGTSYVIDSNLEYYNSALDQILGLRLKEIGHNGKAVVLQSQYFEEGFAKKLANDVVVMLSSGDAETVFAPVNLYNKHWLGLSFKWLGAKIEVTYMDSEQRAIVPRLKEGLERGLAMNGYQTQFSVARLEQQRYNNCGLEVIENFVYYLTGTRATQETAVYVHSLLVENNLLDPKEYGLKIAENNKLIGFLSNAAPLPIRSMDVFPRIETPLPLASSQRKLGSRPNPRESGEPGFTRKFGSSGQARGLGLDPSFRWDDAGGGGTLDNAINLNPLPVIEQFNRLWAKWVQDKLRQVNAAVYKTTIGFKGLDLAVDSARLLYKPGLENAKSVALDASYLYSMYSGVNGYSALVSGAEVTYQVHSGEYHKAFNTGAATLNAMALPYILAMCNRPYLGFAYGIWVAANTAYTAALNAYSFVQELKEKDANLKSTVAYKELVEWLAASSLQTLYDFEARATEYKRQINDLLFEKTIVKAKTQGEFEQEAEALMAKHHSHSYEHCVEVRSEEDVKPSSEYDCYNMSGHGELLI